VNAVGKIRKKFLDGRMTPQEAHSKWGFPVGAKCVTCGKPPLVSIRSFAEEGEMLKRDPMLKILQAAEPVKYQEMQLRTKQGTYLRIACVYACAQCASAAEKAAARHPSWMFVDIDRGPLPTKIVIGPGS